jgi:hypothetical protein
VRRRFDTPDFVAGLLVTATGAFFLYFGSTLSMGSARSMGPGYFPRLLAWIMLGLGVAICVRGAIARRQRMPLLEVRPIGLVLAGLTAFFLLLEPAGLILATIACVVVSSLAAPGRNLRGSLVLAAGAAAGATLVFAVLLGLPFPVWPR